MHTIRLLISALLLVGCGASTTPTGDTTAGTEPTSPSADASSAPEADTTAPEPDAAASEPDAATPRVFDPAEWFTHEAGPFTVPAGQERFYCYSVTLEEDVYVDEIALVSRPVVHHVMFTETTSPDPDGFFECSVLFQNNWVPIFVAGTGDASLAMPEGAGHILKKGTQLTMQLHLLNASTEEVTETIPIHLHRMSEPPAEPVEVVVFGSMNIALPPGETSDVVGNCASDSDMQIFSMFPHMHLLGERMVVETGSDPDNLTEIFRRDPYDFDDQYLQPIDLAIAAGDTVRVTCTYDNFLNETVTFGESTTNEMCFILGFATGATHQLAGCIGSGSGGGGGAGGFLPEGCGTDPPNELGLGASCTEGGGECNDGFTCSEDIEQAKGPETCISFNCEGAADCGEGGVCCGIEGYINVCLPPSCMLPICNILP